MAVTLGESYAYHFGGRRGGKTTFVQSVPDAARAYGTAWDRDWQGAGCAAAPDLLDAGIVADPIIVTDADLRTAAREDLAALEGATWLPGVVVSTSFESGRRAVRIGPATPCVTSIP